MLARTVNAYSSYVPLKFAEFHVSVRDYQTGVEIGTGNNTMTVAGRKTTDVTVSEITAIALALRRRAHLCPTLADPRLLPRHF